MYLCHVYRLKPDYYGGCYECAKRKEECARREEEERRSKVTLELRLRTLELLRGVECLRLLAGDGIRHSGLDSILELCPAVTATEPDSHDKPLAVTSAAQHLRALRRLEWEGDLYVPLDLISRFTGLKHLRISAVRFFDGGVPRSSMPTRKPLSLAPLADMSGLQQLNISLLGDMVWSVKTGLRSLGVLAAGCPALSALRLQLDYVCILPEEVEDSDEDSEDEETATLSRALPMVWPSLQYAALDLPAQGVAFLAPGRWDAPKLQTLAVHSRGLLRWVKGRPRETVTACPATVVRSLVHPRAPATCLMFNGVECPAAAKLAPLAAQLVELTVSRITQGTCAELVAALPRLERVTVVKKEVREETQGRGCLLHQVGDWQLHGTSLT